MEIIKKLAGDKSFWAAVVLAACNLRQTTVAQICEGITMAGTFIAYIIGNGIQQAAQIRADAQITALKLRR